MKRFFTLAVLALLPLMAMAQPKVVGHRGCRFDGPFENTLASMKVALDAGVDAIEFDINLTCDDQVIVFHGPGIPGPGNLDIHHITFAEARKIMLPGGHQMPTLEEWLAEAARHPEVRFILEFKRQLTPERETMLVEKGMAIVRKCGMTSQIEYTAFGSHICDAVKRVDPSAKVIYLESGVHVHDAQWARDKGYEGISYDLNGFLNNPWIADQARRLGVETTLWLVNDYEVADWAVRHGIDWISSDHPEKLAPYVRAVKAYRRP